jgi:purine-binding chemotaxis protein CheW
VPSARNVIIVTHIGARLVGLLVDAVSDILTVAGASIQPTPDVACDMVKSFVRGILTVNERMISLVALDRILPELEAEAA